MVDALGGPSPLLRFCLDVPISKEFLQNWIDRSRSRSPRTLRLASDFLKNIIAVSWLFGYPAEDVMAKETSRCALRAEEAMLARSLAQDGLGARHVHDKCGVVVC